jgi:hypothetical protein
MQERAWNAAARGFDNVFGDGIGPERRQFAMPVDDFVIGADCAHGPILVPMHQHQVKDRELRQFQRRVTSQTIVPYVTIAQPLGW